MNITRFAFVVLIIGFLGRACFLEYTNLVDPTESRYAVVADQMFTTGNWLIPTLPMPEGLTPYLGKPPLHFWLTAISYKLFGVDEWSARLPSLLSTLGILASIWLFARFTFDRTSAVASCLIYLSSGMAFFLAGASVTDVTLTFLVTASLVSLHFFLFNPGSSRYWILVSTICAALSFLTKGPVSLVLIWLPVLLFSLLRRDFSWIKRIPWIMALMVFVLITAPWFLLSEVDNPGFMKYFFWNENIARYLFREYGDRYGSGHVHAYGTSWLILLGVFSPWTLVLGFFAWKKRGNLFHECVKADPNLLFTACWAISTPFFFTFVRQLHAMYLLPAIPPLSVLSAVLLSNVKLEASFKRAEFFRYLPLIFLFLGCTVACIGACLHFNSFSLGLSVTLMGAFSTLLYSYRKLANPIEYVSTTSLALIGLYLISISSVSPFINVMRSSGESLERIASTREECPAPLDAQNVGIMSRNSFSHYWTVAAWKNELGKELKISYVPLDKIPASSACHFLIKAQSSGKVPREITDHFNLTNRTGEWLIYSRIHKGLDKIS